MHEYKGLCLRSASRHVAALRAQEPGQPPRPVERCVLEDGATVAQSAPPAVLTEAASRRTMRALSGCTCSACGCHTVTQRLTAQVVLAWQKQAAAEERAHQLEARVVALEKELAEATSRAADASRPTDVISSNVANT